MKILFIIIVYMFKKLKNVLSLKNLSFCFLVFITGILSILGYLYHQNSCDILLLLYAYYSPFMVYIALIGQCFGLFFIDYLYGFFGLTKIITTNTLLSIISLKVLIIFVYSLMFKNILEKWSINKIINFFIILSVFTILIQLFVLVIMNTMSNIQYIFSNQEKMTHLEVFTKTLKILKIHHGAIINQFVTMKFSSFKIFINSAAIGLGSFITNVSLYVHSCIASFFLMMISNDYFNPNLNKFDRYNLTVHVGYKIWTIFILIFTLLLWYIGYHFFALLAFSLFLSSLFIFFFVGREIVRNIFFNLTNNNIFLVHTCMLLLIYTIPMSIVFFIILGLVDSFFNLRQKEDD